MHFFNFIFGALVFLVIILVVIIALIFVIRLILNLTLLFLLNKYKKYAKEKVKEKIFKKSSLPTEDVIQLSKNKQKEHFVNVERFPTQVEQFEQGADFQEGERLVGIRKPIGFWTALVLGQRLGYLMQRASNIQDQTNKGFWQSVVEAQARGMAQEQNKNQGRSL